MNITGLTGHSGSGKTTVAHILTKLGFYHIDCDKTVHNDVYKNIDVLNKIASEFGKDYVENGTLNRKKLGSLIFSDKDAYKKLMDLIHDDIIKAVEAEISKNSDKHILLDAPTLFEFGMQDRCDRIIGVISHNNIERICARDNITVEQAKLRLANQKTADFFKSHCHIIIENDGDLKSLEQNVTKIAKEILKG